LSISFFRDFIGWFDLIILATIGAVSPDRSTIGDLPWRGWSVTMWRHRRASRQVSTSSPGDRRSRDWHIWHDVVLSI